MLNLINNFVFVFLFNLKLQHKAKVHPSDHLFFSDLVKKFLPTFVSCLSANVNAHLCLILATRCFLLVQNNLNLERQAYIQPKVCDN